MLLHPCKLVASPESCDVEFHRSTCENPSAFLCFLSLPLVDVVVVGFSSGLNTHMRVCECECLTDNVGSTAEGSSAHHEVSLCFGTPLLEPEVSNVVLGTVGCVSCPISCCHLLGCRHPAKPLTYLPALCRHLGCARISHVWHLCLSGGIGSSVLLHHLAWELNCSGVLIRSVSRVLSCLPLCSLLCVVRTVLCF